MTPATRSTTKNVIVELVLLGLAKSKLKDTGLEAMRGVLLGDARLAVLDGAVDLQAVWDLLEAQPGWEPAAALGPLCFVKGLESRLQITVKLPAAMARLSEAEIAKHGAACRPKGEDVDRAISGARPERRRRLDNTAPLPMPRDGVMPQWKKALGIGAAIVTLASLAFLAHVIIGEIAGGPKFTGIDAAEFAGDIPLRSAEKWGNEVHALLVDPSWLKQPEAKRREQLERALQRLADRQLSVLVIEDENKRTRVTAQMFGRPPRVFVRFY